MALALTIPAVASTADAMRLGLGLLVLFYGAAGIEVCFIAATRPRRISLIAALMVLGVPVIFLAQGLKLPVQLELVVLLTTVIAIQAGVGRRVIDTQPAETRNALTAVEATSRETLAGLRQMLGVLRRAEPGPVPGPWTRHLAWPT